MLEGGFRPPREPLVAPGEIECHAADLTATISATMPLRAAQAKLAEFDQWIPIDGDADRPIGELVAKNSSGPLRLGFGAWRDLLLGCQFRIAGGELITAGGRTVKNVAGYDLTKFMVGQRGRFGTIVTVTTRTYRRPGGGGLTARFAPSDRLIGRIIATPLKPRWAALTPDALWLGWLDDSAALDFFQRLIAEHHPIEQIRRGLDEDIEHRRRLWHFAGDYFRASVLPTRILEFVGQARITNWSADAAFGIVIGELGPEESAIMAAAEAACGSATIFRAGQPPRWPSGDVEQATLSRLQAAFEGNRRADSRR